MIIRNSNKLMAIGLFAIALFVCGAASRPADYFLRGSHTNAGVTIPYRLFVPLGYVATARYPLIITLHGSGECGTDNQSQILSGLSEIWAEDTSQARNPCFVFAPQVPDWGSRFPNINMNQGNGYDFSATPETNVEKNIMHCLDSLCSRYSIDTNRIYVLGGSMGAWGTYELVLRYPDKFAAAIPSSGGSDPTEAARIAPVAIWDFHGAVDNTVPTKNSRDMAVAFEAIGTGLVRVVCNRDGSGGNITRAQLKAAIDTGAMHLYTEYIGAGHDIYPMTGEPFLPLWLFTKSRAPSTGITVSAITASPSILPAGGSSSVTFSATITGTATGVTIDLSSIGGSNGVAMSGGAGGVYTYVTTVSPEVAPGKKSIPIHAINAIGIKDAFANLTISAPAQATSSVNIYTDAQSYPGFGGAGMSHAAPVEIATGGSEGSKCYDFACTLSNWWDDFGFAVNNWAGFFDFANADTLAFDVKGPTIAGATIQFSLQAGTIMSVPKIIPASVSAWKTIKVPLSPIRDYQGLNLSGITALYFGLSGVQTGTGHVYVDNIKILTNIGPAANQIKKTVLSPRTGSLGSRPAVAYALDGKKMQTLKTARNGAYILTGARLDAASRLKIFVHIQKAD
jgi:poly(3-hydroxybutyrate) depolymerase